jgi:DNA repair protein RAD16
VTHNTIQSIALLLSHRPQDNANLLSEWEKSDSSHGFKSKSRGKTLIILPTVALRQWQAEIARFTKPGALSVLCYHGNTRSSEDPLHALSEVDVVLTSYKILEIEYRKATAGSKIECSVCGKKFYPEKLRIHRKYFCGENSHRTSAQSLTERKSSSKTRGEDVQTSSSEESEEESEAEIDRKKSAAKKKRGAPQKAQNKKVAEQRATKKGGKGDVGKKNEKAAESTNRLGKGREKEASKDEKIVVKGKRKASSSPAASKFTKKRKAKGEPSSSDSESESGESEEWFDEEVEKQIVAASKADQKKMIPSLLHSVSWFRVICDEAHMIKDRSTSTAKAVFNLVSLNKWCLTGTPLQNRVGELYSLVRFLRIDPFAFYFCKAKGCTCKSLHYVSLLVLSVISDHRFVEIHERPL